MKYCYLSILLHRATMIRKEEFCPRLLKIIIVMQTKILSSILRMPYTAIYQIKNHINPKILFRIVCIQVGRNISMAKIGDNKKSRNAYKEIEELFTIKYKNSYFHKLLNHYNNRYIENNHPIDDMHTKIINSLCMLIYEYLVNLDNETLTQHTDNAIVTIDYILIYIEYIQKTYQLATSTNVSPHINNLLKYTAENKNDEDKNNINADTAKKVKEKAILALRKYTTETFIPEVALPFMKKEFEKKILRNMDNNNNEPLDPKLIKNILDIVNNVTQKTNGVPVIKDLTGVNDIEKIAKDEFVKIVKREMINKQNEAAIDKTVNTGKKFTVNIPTNINLSDMVVKKIQKPTEWGFAHEDRVKRANNIKNSAEIKDLIMTQTDIRKKSVSWDNVMEYEPLMNAINARIKFLMSEKNYSEYNPTTVIYSADAFTKMSKIDTNETTEMAIH